MIPLAYWLFGLYQDSKIKPQELLDQALINTAGAHSFRYQLYSSLEVEGRKEVISEVSGEKSVDGNIHIKGEMVKTPIDIYHYDQTVYNWDSFSKRWMVIKDTQSNSSKVLISELDPLSNFNFKRVDKIKKTGWETVDGSKCAVITCKPGVENELMEMLWQDFTYKIWIDAKERVVRKAELTAVSKNNAQTHLNLRVSFRDYNQRIKIAKPIIN
jgi:hypothetical protein